MTKEFKGNFVCLGEIIFSVPIKNELDNDKTFIYRLKFIDSFWFISASLSSLADNLSEINKKKKKKNQ